MVAPQRVAADEIHRYIAVRHRLVVETAASEIRQALDPVVALCGKTKCEVLSSSAGEEAASISLRIAPEDLPKLFRQLGDRVKEHTTESEDKTGAVIDVEAKIRNLTGFRDSLRAMLPRATAVKDAVEIQKQLADVQSDLDALATRRKMLENETEKVAVEIQFRPRGSAGAFRPLATAWSGAGEILAGSLAALLTAVVAIIPWLIVIVPAAWFGRRLLRRRRRAS